MNSVELFLWAKKFAYAVGDSLDTFREDFLEELVAASNGGRPEPKPEPKPKSESQPAPSKRHEQPETDQFWLTNDYRKEHAKEEFKNKILSPNSPWWAQYPAVMKFAFAHRKHFITAHQIIELYEKKNMDIGLSSAGKLLTSIEWAGQLEKVGRGRWKYLDSPYEALRTGR